MCSREDDPSMHDDPNQPNQDNSQEPRAPIGSGPENQPVEELLRDFLYWLDHNTDTMDPVMISLARELDPTHRHMTTWHINTLVADYLSVRKAEQDATHN